MSSVGCWLNSLWLLPSHSVSCVIYHWMHEVGAVQGVAVSVPLPVVATGGLL